MTQENVGVGVTQQLKSLFDKGDIVYCRARVETTYPYSKYADKLSKLETIVAAPPKEWQNDNGKAMVRTAEPFYGILIGVTKRAIGSFTPGSPGGFGEDYEPANLNVTDWIRVWLVEPLDMNGTNRYYKPIAVLEEDLSLVVDDNNVCPVSILALLWKK